MRSSAQSVAIGLALGAGSIGCSPGSSSESTETETGTGTSGQPSSSSAETGTTHAATDTDTDTEETFETATAGELPDECFDHDPAVDASFTLELPDWGLGALYELTAECTVTALVEVGGGATLRTELTCDHEGVPRSAALEIAAPFSADPHWAENDAVQLRAHRFESNELSKEIDHLVRLSRGPSDLLVFAIDGGQLTASQLPDPSWYAPIALEIDTTECGGYPELDNPAPQQVLRGVVGDCCDGQVRGGQRALFDLSGAYSGFDVDAARVEIDVVGSPGDGNVNHLEVVMRAVDIGI